MLTYEELRARLDVRFTTLDLRALHERHHAFKLGLTRSSIVSTTQGQMTVSPDGTVTHTATNCEIGQLDSRCTCYRHDANVVAVREQSHNLRRSA